MCTVTRIVGFFLCNVSLLFVHPILAEATSIPASVGVEQSLLADVEIMSLSVDRDASADNIFGKDGTTSDPDRFGFEITTDVSPRTQGTWQRLAGDISCWRIIVCSPGAVSLNFIFHDVRLQPGSRMFISDIEYQTVLGPFTESDNREHGRLATFPILGDVVVIELDEPVRESGMSSTFVLDTVVHGFRDIVTIPRGGGSGACNNDVACPEGNPWRNEIRSVALLVIGGTTCTGSLINNLKQDLTPYLLTANHCIPSASTATVTAYRFNYQHPECDAGVAPTTDQICCSTLVSTYPPSDFTLVKLDATPPPAFNVYYTGWNNNDVASTNSTCIHHPSGDVKKISFDYDTVISDTYLGTAGEPDSHWKVVAWDDGTTEGGSSGSGLWNTSHQIVGQLHGGWAACDNIQPDWFGKFSFSWNGGGTPETRLSDWLDPNGTGATTCPGKDRPSVPAISMVAAVVLLLLFSVVFILPFRSKGVPRQLNRIGK